MAKLINKYKILEGQLKSIMSSMKKRTDMEERVMHLGMDDNLVKNLGEIFNKENKENRENDSGLG